MNDELMADLYSNLGQPRKAIPLAVAALATLGVMPPMVSPMIGDGLGRRIPQGSSLGKSKTSKSHKSQAATSRKKNRNKR